MMGSNMGKDVSSELGANDGQSSLYRKVAIETLSDNVLLEIFDLCLDKVEDLETIRYPGEDWDFRRPYKAWYALVHVCQRWRYIVFASPRRLNLRLLCPRETLVRKMLGIWPALPIVIWDTVDDTDEDNIIAALEQRDRVCEIKLECYIPSQEEKLLPLMQESFPALTKLHIDGRHRKRGPVFPDSFLGGSAPRLQFLCLERGFSFPALPNLLLSSRDLVYLHLDGPSEYITPEMVTALSALTRLENLRLYFDYYGSDPDPEDRPPAPLMRSLLPALKELDLGGHGEYLDDFMARFDVPSINYLEIRLAGLRFSIGDLFHLRRSIGSIEEFQSSGYADIEFDLLMEIKISPQAWTPDSKKALFFKVSPHLNTLLCLVEGCKSSLLPVSNIEHFNIHAYPAHCPRNPPLWLELLRQFSAVKSLSLGYGVVQPVAFALKQVIEEGMTDVLPSIRKLSVSKPLPAGPDREAIERFVTARGLPAFE